MKKKILEMVAFCLVACIAFMGVSYALADRETTFSAVYSEPDNSIDVLIVGSSHINSGYIPNMLWEENGVSAVNAFSWSQPMWVSYHYIVEALKTQSPEYIVLEMYGMVYGHSYIMPQEIDKTNYNNSFNLDPSWNRWKLIKTSEFCGLDLRKAQDFLYISRYHSRWKDFSWSDLAYNPHKQHDSMKGYGYLTAVNGQPQPQTEISQDIIEPYEYSAEYLNKIVDLCRKKDIKLVFTMTPYLYGTEETAVLNWVEQYSNEHNISFFNYLYGDDYERIGFDYTTDLSDNAHCNYSGAYKITADLCRYLNETDTDLPAEKENHKYFDMLSDDYNKYSRVLAINEISNSSNLTEWLDKALADSDVSLFINTVCVDDATKEIIKNHMKKHNFDMDDNMIVTTHNYSRDKDTVQFEMFGKNGTIEFSADSADIFLNGTAVPGEADGKARIVLYDNVLERPVMTICAKGDTFDSREFTSDILDNYK